MSCHQSDTDNAGRVIILADPCKDNFFAETEARLESFFDKITQPGIAAVNLSNDLRRTAEVIATGSKTFINSVTGALRDKLEEVIKSGLSALANRIMAGATDAFKAMTEVIGLQGSLIDPVKSLFDGLVCAATKIFDSMTNVVTDLLVGAMNNAVNAPICAVQDFIGAITKRVVDGIDSIVGPLLEPIQKVLETTFKVKDFILGAVNTIRKIQNFFSCGESLSCPATTKYQLHTGPRKSDDKQDDKFEEIFSGTAISEGAQNLVTDFEKQYGKWNLFGAPVSEASSLTPCNSGNPFKCGTPTVEIFGGDGFNATGEVILGRVIEDVDEEDIVGGIERTASIVGVKITNPGSSYTRAPLVAFTDSCGRGYGAYGKANIDVIPTSPTYGQVTSISIVSEGENYPAGDQEPVYLVDVVVEDGGQDYADTDTLNPAHCGDITIVDGRITKVTLSNLCRFDDIANLTINSETGFGAVLRPIMSTNIPPVLQGDLVQVIDCIYPK